METRRSRPKKASLEFKHPAVEYRGDYRKNQLPHALTLRKITVFEKLSENYGMKYAFVKYALRSR